MNILCSYLCSLCNKKLRGRERERIIFVSVVYSLVEGLTSQCIMSFTASILLHF